MSRRRLLFTLAFLSLVILISCQGRVLPTVAPLSLTQDAPSLQENTDQNRPPNRNASEVLSPVASEPIQGIEIRTTGDLPTVGLANAQWVRVNGLLWHEVESQEGVRDWSLAHDLEEKLQAISAQNQEAILIIRGTPEWAQAFPGSFCGPISNEKLTAFATFISETVARYSQPPYNVEYWELGNEPDVDPAIIGPRSPFGCWGDPNDANYGGGYYAEMLKQAYPQIKSIDPEAKVLVGGLLLDCDPLNPPETEPGSGVRKDCRSGFFLQGILEDGGGEFFDGVSFHAYDYYQGTPGNYSNPNWYSTWDTTGPVLGAKANYLHAVLESYGYPDKFLMNTETALLCGRDGKEPVCQTGDFERTKASYLSEANAAALAEGLRANIWYSLRGWRGSQLVDQDGEPNIAFRALQFNGELLAGVEAAGKVHEYPEIKAFAFRTPELRVWLIWSADGSPHELLLAETPRGIFDILGNEIPPSPGLSLSDEPLYVVWPSN